MVWSLALCPDDAKGDLVVYGAEFGVVSLAKGPRAAFIQEGLDGLSFYHSCLEGERYFRFVVELTYEPPDAHPACAGPLGGFNGHIWGFGHGAPYVGEVLHLFVDLPGCFDSLHRPRCTRWRHTHGICILRRHD